MKDIEKFSAFMEGYVAFLEEMAQGEGEKYAALLSYEAKRVDRVVSRQQAMNMRLSQLEEQREREQEEAGLGGLSFQEILARLDKTEQGRLPELFPRFSRAVEEIKYFNGKSMAFAKEGLQMTGMKDGPAAPYPPAGRIRPEGAQGASLFEAKI